MQDIERHPNSAVIVDLSGDTETGLKSLERLKQAVPDLYVIVSHYHADGETVIQAMRMGANDFLTQPIKRTDFREADGALRTRAEAHGDTPKASWARSTRSSARRAASAPPRWRSTSRPCWRSANSPSWRWISTGPRNDVAMQVGATPQYTLAEVAREPAPHGSGACSKASSTRDPLGFYLIGPSDTLEQRGYFTEAMFRDFATFLIEKYDNTVVDARQEHQRRSGGQRVPGFDHHLSGGHPGVRRPFATRSAISALLVRTGFTQDQIRVVVNRYRRRPMPNLASLEQIKQTLNQPVFYGIPDSPAFLAAVNKGQAAGGRPASSRRKSIRAFALSSTRRPSRRPRGMRRDRSADRVAA